MMGYGKRAWQSFPMMGAMDFIKCYDKKFNTLDEYMDERLKDLSLSPKKIDSLRTQLKHQYTTEYMKIFKSKFKEVMRTKEQPN